MAKTVHEHAKELKRLQQRLQKAREALAETESKVADLQAAVELSQRRLTRRNKPETEPSDSA